MYRNKAGVKQKKTGTLSYCNDCGGLHRMRSRLSVAKSLESHVRCPSVSQDPSPGSIQHDHH